MSDSRVTGKQTAHAFMKLYAIEYRIYSIKRPGRLLNFWTLRVGAYSRWAFIRGWALIKFLDLESGRLFEVGAYSRLGAY